MRFYGILICILYATSGYTQEPTKESDTVRVTNDSIRKVEFAKQLGNGYFPLHYFNLDLRYLIKFNQYEGLRTGLGGETSQKFSEVYKLQGYGVYGFRDHRFKYSVGGGFRIAEASNTWLHASYTDDLQETGSSKFLTDKRFFQFFEPRLINIDLFHKHITKALSLEHRFSNKLLSETKLANSKIEPTYFYQFKTDGKVWSQYDLSIAKVSLQWNPFDVKNKDDMVSGYPQFTFQFAQSFKGLIKGDFSFSKIDFRARHKIKHPNASSTEFTVVGGLVTGKTPLTHLYHAYPNNVNKETILQRFSVAGINSFETMYFNEFFSDRFTTLQIKHRLKPFQITQRFKPELVLISRHALGNISHIERHQGLQFGTLDKGYSESGLEINKLIFGFGLSFAYRYGAYHLSEFEDNFAFKFTFNINLDK